MAKTISTNVANTLPTNVMSTVSTNFHNKKVDCRMVLLYYAHSFISDYITIYKYYYLLSL